MNIQVVRERFLETLQKGLAFSSSRLTDSKALRAVLIEAEDSGIMVSATNASEYFQAEVGGKVVEKGGILVEYKVLIEVVKAIRTQKLNIAKERQQILISSDDGVVKIPSQEPSTFPKRNINSGDGEKEGAGIFSEEILEKVVFCAATDDTRPTLTGVCFDFHSQGVNIVGTDGFRMSLVRLETNETVRKEGKIILPAKNILSIAKILGKNTKVYLDDENKQCLFEGGGYFITVKYIDGEFPPYEKVVPSSHKTSTQLRKEDLLSALKTVSLFSREGSGVVNVEFTKTETQIFSNTSSSGEARLHSKNKTFQGEEGKISLNGRFLMEYLNTVKEDLFYCETSGPNQPAVFKNGESDKYLHIIMPIRT